MRGTKENRRPSGTARPTWAQRRVSAEEQRTGVQGVGSRQRTVWTSSMPAEACRRTQHSVVASPSTARAACDMADASDSRSQTRLPSCASGLSSHSGEKFGTLTCPAVATEENPERGDGHAKGAGKEGGRQYTKGLPGSMRSSLMQHACPATPRRALPARSEIMAAALGGIPRLALKRKRRPSRVALPTWVQRVVSPAAQRTGLAGGGSRQ